MLFRSLNQGGYILTLLGNKTISYPPCTLAKKHGNTLFWSLNQGGYVPYYLTKLLVIWSWDIFGTGYVWQPLVRHVADMHNLPLCVMWRVSPSLPSVSCTFRYWVPMLVPPSQKPSQPLPGRSKAFWTSGKKGQWQQREVISRYESWYPAWNE